MYTSGENIAKYIADENVDMNRTYNSTFFNFVDYRSDNPVRDLSNSPDSGYSDKYGPVVQDGEYVAITHSASYTDPFPVRRFHHHLQHAAILLPPTVPGGYHRRGYDQQLNFTNVIILYNRFLSLIPATATTSRMWISATARCWLLLLRRARSRRSTGRRAPLWRPCACTT